MGNGLPCAVVTAITLGANEFVSDAPFPAMMRALPSGASAGSVPTLLVRTVRSERRASRNRAAIVRRGQLAGSIPWPDRTECRAASFAMAFRARQAMELVSRTHRSWRESRLRGCELDGLASVASGGCQQWGGALSPVVRCMCWKRWKLSSRYYQGNLAEAVLMRTSVRESSLGEHPPRSSKW